MPAQPPRRLPRRALDPAFGLAAAQVAAGTVPFVILGIADHDGTVRLESFGAVNGQRIGVDAVCLLASVTKPIVATAVMHEVEAGRLDLAQPLEASLPELAGAGASPYTAWHVLTHTSGIGDVDVEALLLAGGGRDELLRRAIALPQLTAPGSAFRYATAPFDILAEAIARRAGRPFDDVLRVNVLDPLGMTATAFVPGPDAGPRIAPVMVDLPALAGIPASALIVSYTGLRLAGGGLWSTAADVLRFGRAMLRGGELDGRRVLSPAFVDLMTREVTVDGLGASEDVQRSEHYAIGWAKPGIASPASASSFGHGGASGTRLWVDPARDIVFLYLTGAWAMGHEPIDAVQHAVYAALP